jgi:hypothetical protein
MAVTFQRVLSDDELHKRVRAAFGSGRKVYTRVGSDRDIGRVAARFRDDKNAQEALRAFVDDLIAASGRLREKPKKRRRVVRPVIIVSGAAGASTVVAAASGRLKPKPKKRHRVRTMILVSGTMSAAAVVVIRRRRGRDNRIVATDWGNAPTDFPTQAPAHAEAN